MINSDNTNVELNLFPNREGDAIVKKYTDWLKERNIKFSLVKQPIWVDFPVAINMRKEDAIIFRLTFGI
jgi:hypothetical protein